MVSRMVILASLEMLTYSVVEYTQISRRFAANVAKRSKYVIPDGIPPQTRRETLRFPVRRSALTVLAPFGAGHEPQPQVLRRL